MFTINVFKGNTWSWNLILTLNVSSLNKILKVKLFHSKIDVLNNKWFYCNIWSQWQWPFYFLLSYQTVVNPLILPQSPLRSYICKVWNSWNRNNLQIWLSALVYKSLWDELIVTFEKNLQLCIILKSCTIFSSFHAFICF